LFPSMRATVSNLYSLPALPLTPGFMFFSRYTNNRASRITFCETCVVVSVVTTHFRNPVVGRASVLSRGTTEAGPTFSASLRVSVDSNQNKQVIYMPLICNSPRRYYPLTWAANSARLPPALLIVLGICRFDIIWSLLVLDATFWCGCWTSCCSTCGGLTGRAYVA